MIVTKTLIKSKLNRLTQAYEEIQMLKGQIEQKKLDDSKIFLPAIVLENYNKSLNMLQVHKDNLKTIAQDTIADLEKLKERYLAEKSNSNNKDYQEKLDRLLKLATISNNAMHKLIDFIGNEGQSIEDLQFLYIDSPKNKDDEEINSHIKKKIYQLENDNTTKVINRLIDNLTNAVRGNLLNSTIKFFLKEEKVLEGLESISPLNASELIKFKANKSPSELDIQRYKLYQQERVKKLNNQEYDTRIDQV